MSEIKVFKNIFIIILLLPIFLSAQTSTQEIDSLLFRDVKRLRNDAKYEEVIVLCQEIIKKSKEIGYQKGELWGYVRQANSLCTLGRFKESLEVLQKAKQLSEDFDDFLLKSILTVEIGRNYNESKIFSQAVEQFKIGEKLAHQINNKRNKETALLYAYQNFSSVYANQNQRDLSIKYIMKSQAIEENPYNLTQIIYYHLDNSENNDSLEFYLRKSNEYLAQTNKFTFEKSIFCNQWGEYYEKRKDYDKAIEFYKKAEKFARKASVPNEILFALKGLSRCYETKGDFKETAKWAKKYTFAQDSIANSKHISANQSVEHILKNKEDYLKKEHLLTQKVLIFVVLFAFVVVIFLFINMKINKKQKKLAENAIEEKNNLLAKKDEETQILQQKTNFNLDEVIQSVKNNSPEFWGYFQEAYPDFQNKMLALNQDLKPSELILCAQIYLGFTTKDIAEFTFRAVKTIKNNKYNLRKKLEVNDKSEFTIWLRNYIDEKN